MSHNHPLSSLLSILKDKKPESSITPVVNANSIGLMCKLLSQDDYLDAVAHLYDVSDVHNVLDFVLCLLCDGHLPNSDANWRARRLMFKVMTKTPVMPRSLFVTEVKVKVDRDYIAGGGFGLVFKGELLGKFVALKVLYKTHNNIDFCREALMWRSLNHKFVLPFLGIYEQESTSQFFLISPYMENGTLARWRKTANPSITKIEERILEVAQGVAYIHSEGVVHGDLRGANILLDANLHVQIADFGLTRLSEATATQSGALHFHFAAPELFGYFEDDDSNADYNEQQMARTHKSDVYAFARLYYEIYYGTTPFAGIRDIQVLRLVCEGVQPPRLHEPPLSDWVWEMIRCCWDREATKRPTIANVAERMMATLGPNSRPLPFLLSILDEKKPGSPITSVINAASIDLLHKLLSRKDYINIAVELSHDLDVKNMLDFILYVLHNRYLSDPDATVNINQRARQVMAKIIMRTSVMPRSLFLNGIVIPTDSENTGRGGFGHIFKGELWGVSIALKAVHKIHCNIDFCREALMWRSLNHKFVLPFLGVYENESASQFFLVSPYMENGTLAQWRKKSNPSTLEIEERILEVAQGIEYIHSEGVVHGDLCGDNILLDTDFHVQITDFGLTRLSESPPVTRSNTLRYSHAAPELLDHSMDDSTSDDSVRLICNFKTQKLDVYAFGCLFYEIHYDRIPFAGAEETQIVEFVSRGELPPRFDEPPLTNEAWELIRTCWARQTAVRPEMKDVTRRMKLNLTMQRNSDRRPLLSLLSILRERQLTSPISALDPTCINLLFSLLSKEDYNEVAKQLSDASDANNLLDCLLYILCNDTPLDLDVKLDVKRRARRLISKIAGKGSAIPRSLVLAGVTMPADFDGGGSVVKGELRGSSVTLMICCHKSVNFCREALMWRSLHHKFVLPLLGIYEFEPASRFFIASPYMTNGTLAQWRKTANPSPLEVEKRILEVARGIHYIHTEGVVHGDIRGDNIFLDADLHVKIAGFGLTRYLDATSTHSEVLQDNISAPELFEQVENGTFDSDNAITRTQESDISAFGCLYYVIHYDTVPFAHPESKMMQIVSRGDLPLRLDNPPICDDAWRLIRRCWVEERRRPAIRDIVKTMSSWKTSPSLSTPGSSYNHSVPTPAPTHLPSKSSNLSLTADEGAVTVAIDFGTALSGVAYGSAPINIRQILKWPGSDETFGKIPTCLLYDRYGQVLAWGLEATNTAPLPDGAVRCEWFKLSFEPQSLYGEKGIDSRLPRLPQGKQAVELITDFLRCLWQYAKEQITSDGLNLDSADVWLTVPAAWDEKCCNIMREAASKAGLVQHVKGSDTAGMDRLHIITEPEAAVHCVFANIHRPKPAQNFMIIDAGGGTCDLTVFKTMDRLADLEITKMHARSGRNCGSIFLDLRFRELVKILLFDHPVHLDEASLAYFVNSFSKTDKLTYRGCNDESAMFHLNCFNSGDRNHLSAGLIDGQLLIPGKLLQSLVFDPVVSQVLSLIEEQMRSMVQPIEALFIVGGFAGNEYLRQRIEDKFASKIGIISRPIDADTATLRGAVRYGLAKKQPVSSVVAPRSYMIKVKLPAEPEDLIKRPTYVRPNDAGANICENRLQYLLVKGAIVRKGQRPTAKFCKFSRNALDSMFVTNIFASEAPKVLRYTDEGETTEVCKWTVDLSSLPTFIQNSNMHNSGGFYTEFELGLELDNAEVRGVLMYKGRTWGSVTLDFF